MVLRIRVSGWGVVPSIMSHSNLSCKGVWQVVTLLEDHIFLWLSPGFRLFLLPA